METLSSAAPWFDFVIEFTHDHAARMKAQILSDSTVAYAAALQDLWRGQTACRQDCHLCPYLNLIASLVGDWVNDEAPHPAHSGALFDQLMSRNGGVNGAAEVQYLRDPASIHAQLGVIRAESEAFAGPFAP